MSRARLVDQTPLAVPSCSTIREIMKPCASISDSVPPSCGHEASSWSSRGGDQAEAFGAFMAVGGQAKCAGNGWGMGAMAGL
jgi:hypothetical protein